MTRIICDTMIWYELSGNRLEMPDPEKYTLVCTHLSFTELALTQNSFKNLEQIQNVVRKILSIEPEVIICNPFDHARTLIDTEFIFQYKIEEDLVMGFLRVLLSHPKDGLGNTEFKHQLADVSSKRRESFSEWAAFLNRLHEPSKEVGSITKKYYTEALQQEYFRNWFVFRLNQLNKKKYPKDLINWKHFEFVEKVGARYKRNMLVSKMKADRNDDSDLQKMIYVQPGDQYWTLEKRWRSIMKEVNLEKYLYA